MSDKATRSLEEPEMNRKEHDTIKIIFLEHDEKHW